MVPFYAVASFFSLVFADKSIYFDTVRDWHAGGGWGEAGARAGQGGVQEAREGRRVAGGAGCGQRAGTGGDAPPSPTVTQPHFIHP